MRFAFKKNKEPFCKLRTIIRKRQQPWIYYLEFADILLISFSLLDSKHLKTKYVNLGILIRNVYIILETAFQNDSQYYNL